MTTHSSLYIDNSAVLKVEALRDRSGELVTGAAVVLEEFVDKSGNAVAGMTTPTALTETSTGTYEVEIPYDIDVTAGKVYRLTVSATYLGYVGEWTETVIAKRRAA